MLIALIYLVIAIIVCLFIAFVYLYNRQEYYNTERFEKRLDQLDWIATIIFLLCIILIILFATLWLLQK